MIDEVGKMWKLVVAYCTVLSQHSALRVWGDSHEISLRVRIETGPPEYETGVLITTFESLVFVSCTSGKCFPSHISNIHMSLMFGIFKFCLQWQ